MTLQPMPGYFFTPQHIVLVGASERPHSLGERILTALLSASFQGRITPVNLRHKSVAGIKAHPNLNKVEHPADLVIAVTPPESYETLFKACRKKQFHHLVLIQDWDNLPADAWQTAAAAIKKHHGDGLNISVCTTAGIQLPTQGINAGILPDFAAGHTALLTGHTAVSGEIDIMLRKMHQGASRHISLNYALSPTSSADWINRFGHNRHTRVAVIEHNPLENQRKLFSAIRHFTRHTPLILYCTHAVDEAEQAILESLSRRCNFLPALGSRQLEAALHACLADIRPLTQLTVLADTPPGWLHASAEKLGIRLHMPSEKPQLQEGCLGMPTPALFRSKAAEQLQSKHTQALLALIAPGSASDEHTLLRTLNNLSAQTATPLLIANRFAEGLLRFDTAETALQTLHFCNTAAALRDGQNETAPPKTGRLKNIRPKQAAEAAEADDMAKLAEALSLPPYRTDADYPAARLVFRRHPRYGAYISAHYQGRTAAVLPPFNTLDSTFLVRFTERTDLRTEIEQFVHSMNALAAAPQIFPGEIVLNIGKTVSSGLMPSETKKKAAAKRTNKIAAAAGFIRSTGEAAAGLWHGKADNSDAAPTTENVLAPYPSGFPATLSLNNGQTVTVRPFEPEDAQAKQAFVRSLTPQSRHSRFLTTTNELPQATLARLSRLDYHSEGAWIAENSDGLIVGISRFSRLTRDECEFGITLSESVRGTGLAYGLMQLIIRLATQQGYTGMSAEILKENTAMLKLAEKSGFTLTPSAHDPALYQAKRPLLPEAETAQPQQSQ